MYYGVERFSKRERGMAIEMTYIADEMIRIGDSDAK